MPVYSTDYQVVILVFFEMMIQKWGRMYHGSAMNTCNVRVVDSISIVSTIFNVQFKMTFFHFFIFIYKNKNNYEV